MTLNDDFLIEDDSDIDNDNTENYETQASRPVDEWVNPKDNDRLPFDKKLARHKGLVAKFAKKQFFISQESICPSRYAIWQVNVQYSYSHLVIGKCPKCGMSGSKRELKLRHTEMLVILGQPKESKLEFD